MRSTLSPSEPPTNRREWLHACAAGLVWCLGWGLVVGLDGRLDLANQAMALVATAALAALWMPAALSVMASAVSVLAFNWWMVPPRGTLNVASGQNVVLLVCMAVTSAVVCWLLATRQDQALQARQHAHDADQLREWAETLRDTQDTVQALPQLEASLPARADPRLGMIHWLHTPSRLRDESQVQWHGDTGDAEWRAALWHALLEGRAMGPGTGYHEDLTFRVLPLRGTGVTLGAVAYVPDDPEDDLAWRHGQALCDQWGQARQRELASRHADEAREWAQQQSVRNAMLASVSHDYRTPLAALMGAASSLEVQGERMSADQRRSLAHNMVEEIGELSRITDNTLQLARLEAPGVQLRCDWESAEEVVGAALHRARRRGAGTRIKARMEPGLPLLWCDGLLMAQLLDNLIDNALKYSPPDTLVEVQARRMGTHVMLAVRDRGPGLPPAWRDRVFEAFQRGPQTGPLPHDASRRGAGVGLAVGRAIARAHGGELKLRARGHGGLALELELPIPANVPTMEPEPE